MLDLQIECKFKSNTDANIAPPDSIYSTCIRWLFAEFKDDTKMRKIKTRKEIFIFCHLISTRKFHRKQTNKFKVKVFFIQNH